MRSLSCKTRLLPLAAIGVLLLLPASAAKAEMEIIDLDPEVSLHALHFFDEARGLALASTGRLYRTEDGGRTWQAKSLPGSGAYRVLHFAGESRGWIGGAGGALLASRDRGRTWHAVSLQPAAEITSIFFLDEERGWIGGVEGNLWITRNGGETFSHVKLDTSDRIQAIYFGDPESGAVASASAFFRTGNGGKKWKKKEVKGYTAPLFRILPAGSERWVAVGSANRILTSAPGGKKWKLLPNLPRVRGLPAWFDLIVLTPERWLLIGSGGIHGSIAATEDGGETWLARDISFFPSCAARTPAAKIILGTIDGKILLTDEWEWIPPERAFGK